MLKKIFNMKKIMLGISATALTVAAGVGVYQNVNNGKGEKSNVSFEQKLVTAAKQYVEGQQIAIETEIKTTAEYLEKTGDFSREKDDGQCADHSYVIVTNDNGTYSYEPVLICENPEESKAMNLAIGYMMEEALDSVTTPALFLDYELTYSTKLPTNGAVMVKIETNIPAAIITTTRPDELDQWIITSGPNGNNTVFTKAFYGNAEETINIDDTDYGLGTDRTINIKVSNIDTDKPIVTGVKDGETYAENKTISFNEGTATLKKENGETESFKSGTTVTEGVYELVVKDAAGNTTTVNFTIDTTAPKIKLTSGDKTAESTGVNNTVNYYNQPVTVEVTDTTELKNLTYSFNNGPEQTFTSPMTFNQTGTYVISATDSSSETGFTSTKTFVYNTTKPEIKNVSHNGYYAETKTVVIEDDLPITATFTRNGGAAQNFTVASHYENGKYVTSTVLSSEGKYVISATDAAGNTLEIPNTEVVIDKTAPTISGIQNNGYYGNSESVKIEFSDNLTETDDLVATLTTNNGTVVNDNFRSGTTLKDFADGIYKLTVVDKTNVNKVEYTFTVDTQNKVEVEKTQYDRTPTKDPVLVTITFNKAVQITSANAGRFTATNADSLGYATEYTITVSDSNPIEFTFKDRLNLSGNYTLTVSNIDIKAPTFVNATVNPSGLTNVGEVEVTLNFSEPVRMTGDNASIFNPVSSTVDSVTGLASSYTVPVTENGRISFSFEDQVGNKGSYSYNVTNIDRVPPTVTISSGGKIYTITKSDLTNIYYFKGTVTVRFSDDRTDSKATATYGNDTALYNGAQIKGEGVYTVDVVDTAKNTTTVTFVIDTTAPTVTLSPSKNGTDRGIDVYNGNVNITVDDENPVTVMASLNGKVATELTERAGRYVISAEDGDGVYLVTITDAAGNAVEKEFRIDSTKPVITLTSSATPFDFNNVTYYSKPVSFSVSDATATTVTATLNGANYELSGNTLTESGVYKLTATDAAGNTETKDFAIDSAKPVIEVSTNANHVTDRGVEVYGGNVTITVTDATLDKVMSSVNGSTATELTANADGKYVITAANNNGLYTITATDKAGNSNSTTFRIDTEAPVLTGVTNNQHYKVDSLSINISDASSYTASYTKDGGEEVSINGTVVLTAEGKYTVTATDVVGNKLSTDIVFVIDRTAPVITGNDNKEIANGTYFGKDDTIKINVTDTYSTTDAQKTITLTKPDGTTETITSGTVLTQGTYRDGEYSLTVTDAANNSKTITFYIDTQDPDITPVLPDGVTITNNAFTTKHEVAKSGSYNGITITAAEGVTVTKVITNSEGTEITSIPLTSLGTYTITYTAENRAHNKKVITETVIVKDETAPTITVVAKDKDGNTITGTTLTDKNGNNIVVYSGKVTVTATDILSSDEYLRLHSLDDDTPYLLGNEITENGKHVIKVTDEEGNTATETFIIDTRAPEITGLVDGETISGTTYYKSVLNLTFSDRLSSYLDKNTTIKISYSYNHGPEETVEAAADGSYALTLDKDGSYVLTVEDEVGNKETLEFELDATAPSVESITTDLTAEKPTTNGNVTLTVKFSEDVTILSSTITVDGTTTNVAMNPVGNSKNTYTIVATDNGVIEFTYKDAAGQQGTKGTYTVTEIDRENPSITINVSDPDGKNDWYKKNPTISIRATDDSGIDATNSTYEVKIGSTVLASGSLEAGINEISYTTDLSGDIVITANVTDKAGNSHSTSKTVKKDATKPTVTITDKDGNSVSGTEIDGIIFYTVPVKVNATDTYSGNVTAVDNNGEYTLGNLISANAKHSVAVTDEAGNSTILSFAIDTEAPTINGLPTKAEGETYYKQILNLTFTDNSSTILKRTAIITATIQATYKTGETETITVNPRTEDEVYAVTLNKDGKYVITLTDEAGNTKTETIELDATAPSVESITTDLTTEKPTTNGNVTLTVKFSEDVTILSSTITVDGTTTSVAMNPVGNSKNTYTIVVSENGVVEFTYKDVAGHEGTKGSYTVTEIDRDGSTININVSAPDGNNGWYKTNPTINISVADDSGIDSENSSYEVKIGNTVLASGTLSEGTNEISYETNLSGDIVITANVTDKAGNSSSNSKTVRKDATLPTFTVTDEAGNPVVGKEIDNTIFYKVPVKVNMADTYSEGVTALDNGSAYLTGHLISTNGAHSIVATDAAGNPNTLNFAIDTEAPEINGLPEKAPEETYYKQVLNLTFTDESTTILNRPAIITATIKATYKTGETETITVNPTDAGVYAVTLDQDGTYEITLTDEVGNTKTETINVDAVPPVVESITTDLTTEKPTTNGNVTLTVTFSEDVTILSSTITPVGGTATHVDMEPVGDSKNVYTIVVTDNGLVEFTYRDEAGHEGAKGEYTVTEIDRIDPTINITVSTPDGNKDWHKTNPTISIRVTDDSGIDSENSSYEVKIGSTVLASGSLEAGINEISYTTDLSGDIVITANATDKAGNSHSESKTAKKDATLPTFTVTDEKGNAVSANSSAIIDGITFYNVPVRVNATDTYSGNVTATDNETAYILGNLITETGRHSIVVIDEAGNKNTLDFVIDTEAPEISGLVDKEEIGGKDYYKQALNLTFTDNSSRYLTRPAIITATIQANYKNGESETITVTPTDAGVYEITLDKDGEYSITLTDEAKNTKTTEFVLDATAPTVEVSKTPSGLTQSNVTAKFEFSENVTIISSTITVNGTTTDVVMNPVGNSKDTYTVVATNNGTITITFEDEAKHRVTDYTYEISNIDRKAPSIKVTSEAAGIDIDGIKYYNKPVTVTATDNMSDTTKLTAKDGNAEYTLGTEITTNGTHTITVRDEAGNEETVTFVIDLLAPSISLENNSFHNTTVTFTATDAETDVTTVVAKHTPVVGDVTTTTLTKNAAGNYTLTEDGVYEITATDKAGNTTTRKVTVDSHPPVISVDDNSFHKTDVEFTVTDQTLKTVVITKDNEAITLEPVDGKYTATLEGVYKVTATDESGLSTTRTFTIDKTAPKLKVGETVITNNQIFGNNITFTTDDKTPVTVTTGEGSPSITNNGNGTYTTTTDGTYVIELTDKAGNTATVKFVIDSKDPITDLVGEKYYKGKVDFTVTDTTNVTVKSNFTPVGSETATETTLTKDENGKYSVSANGYYEITITDQAGHSIIRKFVIDSVPPVFNIANNSYHKGMDAEGNVVPVNVTIDDATTLDVTFDSTSINGGEANIEIGVDGYNVSGDGVYTFTATDAAENTTTLTFTIDSKAPVIKNIENGKSYKSGVKIEVEDPTLSTIELNSSLISNGATVTGEGTYTITATDHAGNTTVVTFTIDDQPPVVTLPEDITVTEDNTFETRKEVVSKTATEKTYTGLATSAFKSEEPITVTKVMTTGTTTVTAIDLTELGTSTIVYTIADEAGNEVVITETVIVEDTTAPTIKITGDVSLIIVEKGHSVTYPTVTATDIYDGTVAVTDDRNTVNVNEANDYTVTFKAKDSSNNEATETIKVRVLDLDKLRQEERKMQSLIDFMDPNGDKYAAYNPNKDDYTDASWEAKQKLIDDLNALVNGEAKETTTQAVVNAKMNEIATYQLEAKPLDTKEYDAQITRFGQLIETDYTPATWAVAKSYKEQGIASIKLQSDLNYHTRSELKRSIDELERLDLYSYANSHMKEFMADYKRGDYDTTIHEDAISEFINFTLPIMSNHTAVLKSEFDKKEAELRKKIEDARLPIDDSTLKALKKDLADNYNEEDYTKASWEAIQDLIKDVDAIVANPDALRSQYNEAMAKIDLTTLVLIPKVDVDSIKISSSSNTTYAKEKDTITLTFDGNSALKDATVTINGKPATVTSEGNHFTATVEVDKTHEEGKVTYTITPAGEEVTPVTKESNIIVDHTAPTLNISASAPDGLNNWYKTNPTINIDTLTDTYGINYENSTYEVKVGETVVATGKLVDGETTIPVTTELSGTITVTVTATDNARNSTSKTVTVKKDAIKPTVTITTANDKDENGNYITKTFNGIGESPVYSFKDEISISATDNETIQGYPVISLNGVVYVPGAIFKTNLERNEIVVTDEAGNTTTVYVVIDTEAPTIIFKNSSNAEATGKTYQENGKNVTYYKENLTLEIKDNVDKALDITAKFTPVDGEERDFELATTVDGVSTASLTEEGTYVFTATDDSGYTTTKTIVIDKTAPKILEIKNGDHYNHDITIKYEERNLLSATLTPDSTGKAVKLANNTLVTKDVNDAYTIKVTDKAGNTISTRFRIDTKAPVVTGTTVPEKPEETAVSQVMDHSKTWYYTTPVSISYDDGFTAQSVKATYSFVSDKDDTKNFENKVLTNNTTVSEEGTYTITIQDKAGNTDTITFVVDRTVPEINKPTDGGVYGAGVVIDFTEGTAKIDGIEVEKGFNYAVEGTHTIVVTDAAGNEARATFTIDTTAPIVSGIPANGINTSALEITIKDATKTTVTIDGETKILKELLPEEGKTITYNKDGKHKLVAIDEVGNTTEIEFVIDTKAPEITGLGEPYTTETTGSVVTKYYKEAQTLTFNDATLDYVQVNGTTVTLQDMKYTFDKDGLYEVIAHDEAGHTTTERFVIDTKAPSITGVENDKHYKVRPTIEASDANLATITIDGKPLNNEYAEGEHTVTATDKLGHTTSIKFVYDVTAPTIKIVDGENTYTENTTITVEASSGSYSIPNATATDTLSGNRTVKTEGTVDLSKLGEQTITYKATDEAGNEKVVTLTVNVVDNEAPTDLTYEILNDSKDIVNGWYIKPLQVKLKATDNGTGVSEYQYRILSNGTPVTDWIILKDFAEPTFTMPETISGSKITFEVKAFDAANNFITKTSEEFKVDQDAPTVSATVNGTANVNGWYKENINVSLEGTDATSPITHFLYQISLGNDIWTEEARREATDNKATLTIEKESETLYYRVIAVDEAGHQSVVAGNDKALQLDKTAPTVTVDGKAYTENTTVKVEAEADKNKTYSIPTATVTDNLDKTITVNQTGTVNLKSLTSQDVTYTATDAAGNTTTIVLTVVVDDTTAPVITLNGAETESISYGSTYQDKGATATDNLDETVTVTASYKIDTYQLTSYTVTYTAVDKKGNKSTKTRTVTVTPVSTSQIIKDKSDCKESGTCYVKTEKDEDGNDQTANYIWYSGRLWRAYIVNKDNSIKLVTEESMAGFAYNDGTTYKFTGSYAEDWLNGTFYNTLKNAPQIVVPTTYCNARITATTNARETCASKYQVANTNVALLTMDEYNLLGGAKSFLYTGDAFYTMSGSSDTDLVVIVENGTVEFGYKGHEPYAMRPVITIPATVEIVSGKGTMNDPYYIQKNETAKAGANLNERNVGEYVQFGNNGQVWRIMKTTGASTRLISDSLYKENGNYVRMQYGDPTVFTTTAGVGQYLNTTVYNSLFTDKEKQAMLLTKWYYNGHKLGDNPKGTTLLASSTYTYAYVGLASVGEMMTGQSITGKAKGLTSWSINPNSQYTTKSWYFTSVGGADYYETAGHTRGIRPVIELNQNVKIKSGNGTATSPYILEY